MWPTRREEVGEGDGVITDALSKTFNNWVADATYKAAELED